MFNCTTTLVVSSFLSLDGAWPLTWHNGKLMQRCYHCYAFIKRSILHCIFPKASPRHLFRGPKILRALRVSIKLMFTFSKERIGAKNKEFLLWWLFQSFIISAGNERLVKAKRNSWLSLSSPAALLLLLLWIFTHRCNAARVIMPRLDSCQ